MGLTIHYTVTYRGPVGDLAEKLASIRQACLDLPFAEVGGDLEIIDVTQDHLDVYGWLQKMTMYPNNSPENLAMRNRILGLVGVDIGVMIDVEFHNKAKPATFVRLSLWPGEGCEACDLLFLQKSRSRFVCRGFCKTQYAEQFIQCHLLVIRLMDMLKESGFDVQVSDEGDYWQTRDLNVLAKNINDSTAMISSMAEALRQMTAATGVTIVAPIDHSKNIVSVTESPAPQPCSPK